MSRLGSALRAIRDGGGPRRCWLGASKYVVLGGIVHVRMMM